ncbi:MAG: hypothetical protein U9R34_02125 [Nanoarchaeota archaeon]|nr:hypothetical protein [Nanoarchaeota archaeon]
MIKMNKNTPIKSNLLEEVEIGKLNYKINDCFKAKGKVLNHDYFSFISSKNAVIYSDSNEGGGAITYPITGCEYVCKLFTSKSNEGKGIASCIIGKLISKNNSLAWRASLSDNINLSFYDKIIWNYAGFAEKAGNYMVFGIGIDKHSEYNIIKQISEIKPTLEVSK